MSRYGLAEHVFVCLQDDHVVFLDARKDRYFALDAAKTLELGALVRGWPVPPAQSPLANDGDTGVLALLLKKGLLAETGAADKDATPVRVEPVFEAFPGAGHEQPAAFGAAAVYRFIVCAIAANTILRWRGLEQVLDRVRRRNAAMAPAQRPDPQRVQDIIATFAALRPFFLTVKDRCLFETLALSEFLARYGIFPHWVFGVQARPFAAHCWLQMDGAVLNDTLDNVSRYTPILSV